MAPELGSASLRQSRWLLLLLLEGSTKRAYNEPVVGRTRLLKELFLLKEAFKLEEIAYEFIPYYYGPFSPEVYRDLMQLREAGLVQWEETVGGDAFSLTPEGVRAVRKLRDEEPPEVQEKIRNCKERYNDMPLEELMELVYDRFPAFRRRTLLDRSRLLDQLRKECEDAGIDEKTIADAVREFRALASLS